MVEVGALEDYDDVSLSNDTYPKTDACMMINGNDVMGVKGILGSSFLNLIKCYLSTKIMTEITLHFL
jgi:hypothetical protein